MTTGLNKHIKNLIFLFLNQKLIFLFLKTYVVSTQKKYLDGTVLLWTQNIC